MQGPAARRLSDGRLHLQHGPIDVVLRAWGSADTVRAAEGAAVARFPTVLFQLVEELPVLRRPVAAAPLPRGDVARRMHDACVPFATRGVFVTAMAAVAGAVADELLATMRAAAGPALRRAYVNDGGDIALHLSDGESIAIGLVADVTGVGGLDGAVHLDASQAIGGIATSGRHGRSFSLGIADAVTVLARDAATADAAATLIANAVDVPSPAVIRRAACDLDPDSDLGALPVTVAVAALTDAEIEAALAAGAARAAAWIEAGLIRAAALRLAGRARSLGAPLTPIAEHRR